MRVLITGAAGFVGRHLAAHLFAEGRHEIWGVTRARRVIEGLDSRMRLVVADLREKDAVDDAIKHVRPDAVYHLASQASVARSLAARPDGPCSGDQASLSGAGFAAGLIKTGPAAFVIRDWWLVICGWSSTTFSVSSETSVAILVSWWSIE